MPFAPLLFAILLPTELDKPVTPAQQNLHLRPPAVPLLTSDPYLSVWSGADQATGDVTRHWTRHPHPLVSLIRIDGVTYRILGNKPEAVPALPQTNLKVTPTKTTYEFQNAKVHVVMSFLTPSLPNDLNIYARPVTYLNWDVTSVDGAKHQVQIYESSSSLLAVESPSRRVEWKQESFGNLAALRVGTSDQTLLRPIGDDTRINWGYLYAVAKAGESTSAIGADGSLKSAFITNGLFHKGVDSAMPRAANDNEPVLSFVFPLGSVGGQTISRRMMIGYDEVYSIEYFGQKLRPYWRRNGMGPKELFQAADRDYPIVKQRAEAFDQELMADAQKVGGRKYAEIMALSYRECVAANGLAADANGQPLLLTKENTSNGDIATVDVIFPMDPIWVLLSPTLAKASLVSNFMYAASPHWKFPNAPHDLGTYPQITGRDDGGEGMPVEESGNMILLTDAIAQEEGSPAFALKYWPQLTQWAHYLEKYGLDPEDQLCTDDFMGHLAHNANLSVKAILALGAYGDLCKMKGDMVNARKYAKLAQADAQHWMKVANEGDHSLLAFDQPNTWSQKYNLVWDQILRLGLYPDSVRAKEVAFYKKKMLRYGLPLDSRTRLSKTDWSIWSATLAKSKSDFEAIVNPIYDYLSDTTTRDPIADSYMTDDAKSGGMHARPVVGGFFIKMLDDASLWKKWSRRDKQTVGPWATLPKQPLPPQVKTIVGSGDWSYTTQRPSSEWTSTSFNASSWKVGPAGFGTEGTPGIAVKTRWDSDDIWIRRTLTLPMANYARAILSVYHDEDVDVYIDGVLAAKDPGFTTGYVPLAISKSAMKSLRPGATITIAAHCHQTGGGQGIDINLGVVVKNFPPR